MSRVAFILVNARGRPLGGAFYDGAWAATDAGFTNASTVEMAVRVKGVCVGSVLCFSETRYRFAPFVNGTKRLYPGDTVTYQPGDLRLDVACEPWPGGALALRSNKELAVRIIEGNGPRNHVR